MSGAGTILISVDRWSTEAERTRFVGTLRDKGPMRCSTRCRTRGPSDGFATKIRAYGNIIELEDFATSPVMLTEIRAVRDDED